MNDPDRTVFMVYHDWFISWRVEIQFTDYSSSKQNQESQIHSWIQYLITLTHLIFISPNTFSRYYTVLWCIYYQVSNILSYGVFIIKYPITEFNLLLYQNTIHVISISTYIYIIVYQFRSLVGDGFLVSRFLQVLYGSEPSPYTGSGFLSSHSGVLSKHLLYIYIHTFRCAK